MLRLGAVLVFLALSLISLAQPKRPLTHRDYDGWKSIQSQVLSRDGKFLAYALFPEEGDGELVVRNLATGKELHENAGAVPAAPDNSNAEEPEAGPAATRSIRIVFTHDNAFVVASAFPTKADTDKAKKDRKRVVDEMPRGGMIVVNLAGLSASRIADVASFQVPEAGESFVAYLKGPKAGERAAATDGPAQDEDVDQYQRRGGAGNAAAGRRGRKEFGSDLMLRDLRSGKERSFEDVVEFSISKDAKALVYAVGSKKEESNGVYFATPGNESSASAVLAGKGRYTKITWDFAQKQLAFLSDRDDVAGKPAKLKAYVWNRSGAAIEAVSNATAGFRGGFAILDRGPMNFSRDGSRLFVSCAPVEEIAALEADAPAAGSDEKVLADLWSWKDDYIQPMQKIRAAQDRIRSYRAVLNIAEKKFIQVSDLTMAGLNPSDDGRVAIGTDDRAYRHMVDYDGNYSDVYLVDTATGKRTLALKQFRGGGGGRGGGIQLSADGKHALAFKDKQWWSVDVADGKTTSVTAKLEPAFFNEDHDTPDEPPAYGTAGWTKDGRWALVYDRYDVWAVSPEGAAARKLTNGRSTGVQFRVVRGWMRAMRRKTAGSIYRNRCCCAPKIRRRAIRDFIPPRVEQRTSAENGDGSEELPGAGEGQGCGCNHADGDHVPRSARHSDYRFFVWNAEKGNGREPAAGADPVGIKRADSLSQRRWRGAGSGSV